MSITLRSRAVLTAAATALAGVSIAALTGPPAQAATYDKELRAVRAATARFHSLAQAAKAGYLPTPECVAAPPGVMGIHYENAELMASPEIDPLRPEVLLYAPNDNGRLKLVGVEYWAAAAGRTTAPQLFGQRFDGPMPGHHPAMASHYDLHVWLWENNPSGTFAPFNPNLSC